MATGAGKKSTRGKARSANLPPVAYPNLPPLAEIQRRLQLIISDAAEKPENARGLVAARTVATMLYGACIEGQERFLRPSQVTTMSDAQYARSTGAERDQWWIDSMSPRYSSEQQWYAPNSREGVRDDVLRNALVPNSAVIQRTDLAVTSSAGRYALSKSFAGLFEPSLTGVAFDAAVTAWQAASLTPAARARHLLLRHSLHGAAGNVGVTYPNGTTVSLSAGPSSLLTKAVVEQFATRFMSNPAVIWLSESGQKLLDSTLTDALKLKIDPSRELPDLIIADLGADSPSGFTVAFIEVVHSDGPIDNRRKKELTQIAQNAGFELKHLSFVTAFNDRASRYKDLLTSLAWGSFVWFCTEPDNLVFLRDAGSPTSLTQLTNA